MTNCEIEVGEVDMVELIFNRHVVYKALYRSIDNISTSTVKKKTFKAGKNYSFNILKADQISMLY